MARHTAPGVYFTRPHRAPPRIRALRTDVAGFVGVATRGPVDVPVVVESVTELREQFGGPRDDAYLVHAVAGFFANGGRRCWVVRVVHDEHARSATWTLHTDRDESIELVAANPGSWANALELSVFRVAPSLFNLTVRTHDGIEEVWPNLSTAPTLPTGERNPEFFVDVLAGRDQIDPRGARGSGSKLIHVVDGPTELEGTPAEAVREQEGADGVEFLTAADLVRGIDALERVDEVSIVAVPDAMPPGALPEPWHPAPECDCTRPSAALEPPVPPPRLERRAILTPEEVEYVQNRLVLHCIRQRDRFAVLDPYPRRADPQQVLAWRQKFDSKHAALYYPWLIDASSGDRRLLPPSGHVAGVFARASLDTGPHRSPANFELEHVDDLVDTVDAERRGYLNNRGVNAITAVPGRGIRIMGARTLSSDPTWRFVAVRRLVTMIEEAIDEAVQWTVHEPSAPRLWRDIDRSVRGFLDTVWQGGALDGATAEEAYGVRCDESTNPEYEREAGRAICEIDLNPPAPAEFVTVRLSVTREGVEALDGGVGRA